jgi:lipoate-protein ligase A
VNPDDRLLSPPPPGAVWTVIERVGSPRELHAAAAAPAGRLMAVAMPTSGAVVLGSTQPASDFDPARCAAAGLDLVRRRSGGGAVLVQPSAQVWVDFYVPAADPLFCADISRSFAWVGELWASAVLATIEPPAQVAVATAIDCRGGEWARRLCFCGLARGEVTLAGKKVVGLCQRRDRAGAWFHTMAMTAGDVTTAAALLAGDEARLRAASAALRSSATVLPVTTTLSDVVETLCDGLAALGGVSG